MSQRTWATTEDESCYHEECWLVLGHDGLHAYHPALTGTANPD